MMEQEMRRELQVREENESRKQKAQEIERQKYQEAKIQREREDAEKAAVGGKLGAAVSNESGDLHNTLQDGLQAAGRCVTKGCPAVGQQVLHTFGFGEFRVASLNPVCPGCNGAFKPYRWYLSMCKATARWTKDKQSFFENILKTEKSKFWKTDENPSTDCFTVFRVDRL